MTPNFLKDAVYAFGNEHGCLKVARFYDGKLLRQSRAGTSNCGMKM